MRVAVALLLICTAAGAQVLSAHWICTSGNVQGTTLRDQIGELAATLEGPLRVTDRHLWLDGNKNRVTVAKGIPADRLPKQHLTLEAWVKVEVPQEWGGFICCLEDNGADENGFILGYRGAQFMLGIASVSTGKLTYLTGKTRMREGCWNHVVGTYDGTTMRLYVDGALDAESTAQSGPIKYKATHTLALAAYHDTNEHHGFTGRVHELGVDERVLAAEQVEARWLLKKDDLVNTPPTVEAPAPPTAGWPGAMRNARRSGVTTEKLELPLRPIWSHWRSYPDSAWPAPAKGSFWQQLKDIKPRNIWDHAFHPVAVGDDVYYGSSSDDTVRQIDARTGKLGWTSFTGGPVRFAPFVSDDRLYVGSDDGRVYCLDRGTGRQVWSRLIGPSDRLVRGNGRLISPWPVRTGVVVAGGTVYATCGLFPREGCWVVALRADDGSEIWRTQVDQSPQGYLLLSHRALYVPTGRGTPFALARDTGTWLGAFGGPAGAYALVAGGTLVSGPGNKGELQVADTFGKDQLAHFDGNRMLVTPAMSYLQSDTHLSALDRSRYIELLPVLTEARAKHGQANRRLRAVNEALEKGQAIKDRDGQPLTKEALVTEKAALRARLLELGSNVDEIEAQMAACVPWKTDTHLADALVLAGDLLFAGGDGEVAAYDVATGKRAWSFAVDGKALGLAVAGGRLIVGTSRGKIIAFGRGDGFVEDHRRDDRHGRPFEQLPAGIPDRGLVLAVDRSVERDSTVVSVSSADLDRLPARIANAVILRDPSDLTDRVKRVVRPWGGQVFAGGGQVFAEVEPELIWTRGPLEGAGEWTHMYANPANTACSGDAIVGADLQLKWFGGPGPNPMIDRHLRTTPPLFKDGRLFIPGHDRVIAVDGCNGTVLWEREVPGLSRTGAPYDGGHMALGATHLWIADGRWCRGLNVETGEVARSIPAGRLGETSEWGWVCKTDDALFGTARRAGSAIKTHSREEVVRQYGEHQPLITSHMLFKVDGWSYRGGAIVNTTLTVANDRIWFVEGRSATAQRDAGGRVPLTEIFADAAMVCLDARTGDEIWRRDFPKTRITHSLFLATNDGHLVAVGSFTNELITKKEDGTESKRMQTWYEVLDFGAKDGALRWRRDHQNNVGGHRGDHGEQVHHPVLHNGLLFTEPVAYHLDSGDRWNPDGGENPWYLAGRRGCGTFSASATCLYFRNHNPIALPMTKGAKQTRITAVSRPGCWINILPVGGMVLLPEASSGCVCAFPVQTSMGFGPRH